MATSSNPLDLVFRLDSRGPLELVFGDDAGGGSAPEYTLAGGGQITGLRRAEAGLVYDVNVERPALLWRRSGAERAKPVGMPVRSVWQRSEALTVARRSRTQAGVPVHGVWRSVAEQSQALTRVTRSAAQIGMPMLAGVRSGYDNTIPLGRVSRSRVQPGMPVLAGVRASYQAVIVLRQHIRQAYQAGRPVLVLTHQSLADGIPTSATWRQRYQASRLPPYGHQPAPPDPGGRDDWCYVPTDPIELLFQPDDRAPLELVFECERHGGGEPEPPGAPLVILPARFYMSVHSLTAHLLPSLTEFGVNDVSLSADVGSFGWSFSARVRREMFDVLSPTAGLPASIRITFDGLQWVFLVDTLRLDERFGERALRIGGRSVTALIGPPYAREAAHLNSAPRNAQQLAAEALEFTGVDLDWDITDWLVPAGAWSHIGTPLAAVQAIAEAAGGYVQSHRMLTQLQVRHPYPDLAGGIPGGPWNWSDPSVAADVELAPDALMVTSIERRDGADINAVYVSGVSQGVNAYYKRMGTAGEKLASPVTDALIVATEAARMRGRAIVGAGGAKQIMGLELPILTGPSQPGVLDVGQLVQINYASPVRGRVRSVSSTMTWGQKPRQVVSIERHLEST